MCTNENHMKSRFRRLGSSFVTGVVIFLAMFSVQTVFIGTAQAKPMSEKEKINALLDAVESRDDLKFIRLGSAHSGSEAARVLRTKLFYVGSRVKTVDDFIVHIASATLDGSPYFVRYPDGKQIPSAEFLRAELKRITQATAAKEN